MYICIYVYIYICVYIYIYIYIYLYYIIPQIPTLSHYSTKPLGLSQIFSASVSLSSHELSNTQVYETYSRPCTLNPLLTPNPKSCSPDPKPQTLYTTPQTPTPVHHTADPKPHPPGGTFSPETSKPTPSPCPPPPPSPPFPTCPPAPKSRGVQRGSACGLKRGSGGVLSLGR